ncbi:hypothetical protein CLOSYM_01267 [[Clostridium] symbiosum ATCC 14940]|uniref:Uncharacterized protein n=1 Tax=[Clostridium] symbiosum ATCC 14940 TaxID=411472 RepID=A0ABC9U0S7_CLOSY|nr:hypothetical protein CLOSYM_01267 [[Clostridium] symbiosum ATCC 14940]
MPWSDGSNDAAYTAVSCKAFLFTACRILLRVNSNALIDVPAEMR